MARNSKYVPTIMEQIKTISQEAMKISAIVTVLNEEKTIVRLLESLANQAKKANEIIVVDGGSRDRTVKNLKYQISNFKKKNIVLKVFVKRGNRAIGRNEAIRKASGEIIVCTDAGCIVDNKWIQSIVEPFSNARVDVVAGCYRGLAKNVFEACVIPYVLVMPDRINPKAFLPASRSMAFRKKIWKKLGGFPENYSHNEDYVFAKMLEKTGTKIAFAKDAIVYWLPRENLKEVYAMFFRFAYGDVQAGILRPKVVSIFLRYLFFVALLYFSGSLALFLSVYLCYMVWAIFKNYRYVKDWRGAFILPSLQIASDIAIIIGSVLGFVRRR